MPLLYLKFINAEYTNAEYMETLLNDEEFELYQEDIEKRNDEILVFE